MNIKEILVNQYLLFNDYNQEYINFILSNNFIVYENIDLINFKEYNEILNYENIKWIFDNNNYKIPYYNNIKINFIKIINYNIIYDLISSNSLLPDHEIICGENIQNICDVVIVTNDTINCNPNIYYFSKDIKYITDLDNLDKYNSIFIKTDILNKFYNKFENMIENKIIFSHNSDIEIDESYMKILNMLDKQISQNCLFKHPKLIPIPIGIENRQWFNHDIFHTIRKCKDIKKTKDFYFFFSLNTHPSRIECYNILKNKLIWNDKKDKENYFIELKKHKYAICPRGNGIDTHRLWECLYLDVIPIVISSDYINIDNLPIIVLNNWNNFDKETISNEFNNLINSKLTIDYYSKFI
jgi:hypothetical protein